MILTLLMTSVMGVWADDFTAFPATTTLNNAEAFDHTKVKFFEGSGTQADPYQIADAQQLRLLAFLCRQYDNAGVQFKGKQAFHYASAHYVLTHDIDLAGVTDWRPIGELRFVLNQTPAANNECRSTQSNVFQGVFDGRGHTVRNLTMRWGTTNEYEVQNSIHGSMKQYGLFGFVGKGKSTTQADTEIKNIIIDNFRFFNDGKQSDGTTAIATTNSNRSTVGTLSANNSFSYIIGPLAAVVTHGTRITNVDVKKADATLTAAVYHMTDKNDRRIYVGGAIGTIMNNAITTPEANTKTLVKITNVATVIDVDMKKLTANKMVDVNFRSGLCIGGIVGRINAASHKDTKDAVNTIEIKGTMFSGKIDAPLFMVGSVWGSANVVSDYNSVNITNIPFQYEGKRVKNTETYFEPQYAYFHDYFINNDSRSLIEMKRDNLLPQNDGHSYVMKLRDATLNVLTQNDFSMGYQGINGGERYDVSGTVAELNQGELFNSFNASLAVDGGYKWQWGTVGSTKEFHLATGNPASAITIEQSVSGSNVTLTAVTNDPALTEFTWTIDGVAQDNHSKTITVAAAAADRTMQATSGSVSSAEMTLKGSVPLTFTITDNDVVTKRYSGFEKHRHTITPSDGGTYYYRWIVYDENGKPQDFNMKDDGSLLDPESSNTFAIRPHWLNNTYVVGIYADEACSKFVAMKTGTVPRAYLRVEDPSAEKNTFGTSTNNYLIGYSADQATDAGITADEAEANAARELFLLSYLTNMREVSLTADARYDIEIQPNKENNVVHTTGAYYSSRYYKMMGDADFSKAAELTGKPFTPISSMSQQNPNTYSERAFMFRGTFDGQFHAVKNLYMLWRGDKVGANDYVSKWGLFGYIGGINFDVAGIAGATSYLTKQSAVVRNLIIERAVIRHDADETMFSYNKTAPIANSTTSHAAIGVLAGIVGSYATVQNIEVRNSNINDEGSSDYDLWTRGLHIGGVIGSLQYGPQNSNVQLEANGTNRNSVQYKLVENKVENLSAHVNITIEHAKVHDTQQQAQLPLLNVGGIIGRYCVTAATLEETQAGMPRYTFFTGDIKAPNCWVSPIIASTRYKDNNGLSADKYSKQWEGNNAAAGTQLTISDALFYNYRIHDGSDYQLITDNYPYNECAWGARSMASHIDAVDNTGSYSAKEYQGVNYNATYISGSEVASMFNGDDKGGRRMALAILNSHKTNDNGLTYWRWGDAAAAPHMVTDVSRPFYSYIKKNEDIEKPNTYNVVSSDGSTNKYYVWKLNGTPQDTHISELDIPVTATTQKVVVDVYENESVSSNESNRLAQTQYIIKLGKFTCASTIEKTVNGTLNTFTLSLKDESGTDISTSEYDITYQWYLGNVVDGDGAVARDGATTNVEQISQDVTKDYKYVLCHVTITHKESKELVFDEYVSYYVNNNQTAKVVYLYLKADGNNKADTESLTASNGKSYPRPTANGNGETPETPVWSWAEAYKKLDKYTEPTAANVQDGKYKKADGTVTEYSARFTSKKDYDFSAVPLDVFEYDTYKRYNSQRKVKPIDKCSVTWDNNVIVVMGKAMSSYFADATRMKRDDADADGENTGSYADRPVTITGKWNGIDYYGTVINTSAHFSINADHKFENVGFGISGTERYRIYAHRWNVWAGKGILMGWEAAKHAGVTATANSDHYRVNNADGSTGTPVGNFTADIAVMGGYCDDASNTNPEGWEYINHGRDDVGQQILLQSGSWGPVCPGNRQVTTTGLDTYYVMGGPDHPAKTTITVDMDRAWNDAHTEFKKGLRATVDVACLLTGNHEGTMYGDVTLNIKSGKMGRIVNGIKGAQRVINSNDKFTTDGHYRHVMKVNNEWVEVNAPAPDSYFGRGVINIIPNGGDDSKVNVIELYCGGLGRGHNDGSYHPEVCTYFYGLSEVNIYGGTFENTIYGSGAGGVNGIGTATNHTDDQGLPYWNTDRETVVDGKTPHVWYAPYEYIKKVHSYDFVKVKATPTVYRGADPMNPTPSETYTDTNLEGGYVNLEKTRNIINIYGGVFGSESNPVSIYGGGNGAASAALINPGSQQKSLGVSNYYNTPNHQAGNMYGAAEGLTSEINITGNTKIYGNIYGGGKGSMRYYRYFTRVANNATNTVSYTNAFQNYTMYGGTTKYESGAATSPNISAQTSGALWLAVQDLRLNADNYLNLGQIYGNTKVSLGGNVEVFGNVYGGGEGVADMTLSEFLTTTDAEFGLNTVGTENLIFETNVGTAKDPQTGISTTKRTAYINSGDQYVTFPEMGKIFGSAQLEVKDNVIIHGNLYGGGDAGAITGSAQVDIRDAAQIYGKVYGAGKGLTVDKSKDYTKVATIKGDTHVNLSGERAVIWKDMFGGGENAVVTGNTNFIMTNGNVAANIYGGGEGKVDGENITKASILKESEESTTTGNTNVSITGGKMIWDRTSLVNEKTMYRYQVIKPAVNHTNELYESRDASTIEAAKAELEANGYTVETVTANGSHNVVEAESTITIYDYRVTYTEPATSKIEAREEPYSAAYLAEHTDTKVADPATATLTIGTIIDWNDEHKGTFYDYENGRFLIEHNILGGGYLACDVQGNANVHMTQGLIGMDLLKRMEWKEAYNRHEYPHFYVFGGGYGIHTKVGKSDVYVALSSKENESTGTDEQLARPRNGTAVPLNDDGDDDDSGSSMNFDIISNNYGLPDATVLGILGGGYNGYVGESNVVIGGTTFTHRVYGGGLGSLQGWQQAGSPATYVAQTDATGYSGIVHGNTMVTLVGGHVYGDAFGGGAGVAPKGTPGSYTDYPEIARVNGSTTVRTYSSKDYYNYMKNVMHLADNDMPYTWHDGDENTIPNIYGSVYGGGDVANVTANANVELHAGNVFGYTIGAGYGRKATEAADYTTIGKVGGDSKVVIEDGATAQPYAWNDVYGGGRNGLVGRSAYVHLNGGNIGDNVFGGGWGAIDNPGADEVVTSADVAGNTIVTVDKTFAIWNKVADVEGNIKTWKREDYIKEATDLTGVDPLFYNVETKRFVKNHNIYGGGNVACVVGTVDDEATYATAEEIKTTNNDFLRATLKAGAYKTGNTIVMMNESHVSDPDIFYNYAEWNFAPRWSQSALCWLTTLTEQREPQFSVFGGGYGLRTKTLHDAQARVEVLAVKYSDPEKTQLMYVDGDQAKGPVEHWTTGWDYAYEHKLEWTDEENDGGTAKSDLANFFPEKNWLRPNYVEAERRLRTAAFAKQIGVAGNTVMQVIGGGYNGSVGRNTLASAQSRVIVGKVYGGGFGSFEGWTEAKEIDNGTPNLVNKVGTVGGLAVVEVDRGGTVYGDVFGGGAGIESRMVDDVMTDFTEVARVDSTHVYFGKVGASEKYDFVVPIVYGSIYGGGDVANVTNNATTDLYRGQVMQYLFGGGNGRLSNLCNDYTTIGSVKDANVYFHEISKKSDRTTPFSKTYGSVTQTYIHEPYVWNRTYAGGRNGIVRGNTNMVIYGGQFGHDIFGGGWGAITDTDGNEMTDDDGIVKPEHAGKVEGKDYFITSADVKGNTNITVKGGSANIDQIWDVANRKWEGLIYDENNEPYTPQYDFRRTIFLIKHNIYTGGNVACNVGTLNNEGVLADNTGDTNLTMNRGMLNSQYFESFGNPFLESWEWRDVYAKHGTPFFCLFGGGFGKNAAVYGDTNVTVDIKDDDKTRNKNISPVEPEHGHNHTWAGTEDVIGCYKDHNRMEMKYTKFPDGQSVMDVVGGGYNGPVGGTCNITIDGQAFLRNVFGGAYYSPVGSTNVIVHSGNIDNIYGGGMLGDVNSSVNVSIGQEGTDDDVIKTANSKVVVLGDVYGGNDVSGNAGLMTGNDGELTIGDEAGVNVTLRGGHVVGNVYGGGNGDYLYKIDPTKAVVTADEEYIIDDQKRLVFRVPMRADIGSYAAATDVQKIVNISTYRPVTVKTTIDIKGNAVPVDDSDDAEATADMVRVDGYVFGGGNSCTVSDFAFPSNVEYDSQNKIFKYKSTAPEALRGKEYENVSIRLGSNIRLGGVFYGSDGDAMFKAEVDNQFIRDFPNINNIKLLEMIDWKTAPGNLSLSEQYLRTPTANRPNVYKNMLDIYFMPVEMNVMPRVYFGNTESWLREAPTSAFSNAVVGTWCCGGNRGNMTTDKQMRVFLPAGLTVTGNIIGGCNNANYTLGMSDSQETISHVGGYLLGTHGKTVDITTGSVTVTDLDPQIDITVNCAFRPKSTGTAGSEIYDESCNIYGGCYLSGNINGDVRINMRSNLLSWMDQKILDRTTAANRAVGNVYGAGYGMNTYVYGDTRVQLGGNVRGAATQATTQNSGYTAPAGDTPARWSGITNGYDWTGKSSVNYIYGGGQQGTLVGNSAVRIFNGRVAGSVCGGSYAGYQYGSTQVMLGYATYYRCNVSGVYNLLRKDADAQHADYKGMDGKPVIKQTIHVLKGEFIPKSIYDAISGYDAANSGSNQLDNFALVQGNAPQNFGFANWNDIDIVVDKAVYGGGYALASGSSVGAGVETVKKFDADHQICSSAEQNELYGIESVAGYGGNTQVTIGDNSASDTKDHITVSSPLLQVLNLKEGDDLFGLYTRDNEGNLIYITNPDLKYHVPGDDEPQDLYYTNTYKFTGEGGVYGDGHLTLSEGFRMAEFVGYGYNGTTTKSAKLLNCIHRFDIARITDCCMSLLGDRDYAANNSTGTSSNTTPYSLARIGELQMFSSIDNATTLPALSTTVDDKLTYNKRARNYIGLSNTVRNLGAVYSDVDFNASWHGADGNMLTDASTSANYTYKSYKQAKITRNYDETNHKIKTGNPDDGNSTPYADDFNTRNTGTAKNMIGISSGYALVVQNDYGQNEENSYYGPIHGVVQIALINVRPSEAGGYVYAQNIHSDHTKFLNTSGNFVFPNTSPERRIIDDCFPKPFGTETPADKAEGHYWYVSGYKYYYNATITGYTFNSNDNPISFDMDNTNSLIALSGCKANQPVTVKYFKIIGNHKTGYDNCDIEDKFKSDAVNQSEAGYRMYLSVSDDLKYKMTGGVPNAQLTWDSEHPMTEVTLSTNTQSANPFIALQLIDNVDNNNTKDYYEQYLSDPCHAVLVLSAPVIDEEGHHVEGLTYVRVATPEEGTQYYVMTDEGDYKQITYHASDPNSKYNAYYKQDNAQLYYEYTVNLTINYVHGPNYDGHISVQNCALPGEMIRLSTSDLTIITDDDMPQTGGYWTFGPAEQQSDDSWRLLHEDGINISGSTVTFNESNGNMYFLRDATTAAGNYSADLKGYFLNPDNQDLYIPAYYFMNGYAAEYVFTVRGIDQPVHVKIRPEDILTVHNYHRMSARPSDEANAKSIDLKMEKAVTQFRTVPTLVQKSGEADDDYNNRQNAFAAIWQSKHHRPRVFIEDQRDLMEFGAYIHGQGGTPTPVTYTPSAGGSVLFTPSALSADAGKDMDFMLMANLDIPAQYPTPDNFAGNFHGNGYTLSNRGKSESEQAALTKGLTGNVYNTGFYSTTKVRAIQGGNGETGKIYNCFYYADDNSMPSDGVISGNVQLHNCYTNAGTSAYPGKQLLIAAQSLQPSAPEGLYLATNEAFEYGRVAYNLNQYYLDMRYKKGVNNTDYDEAGYVEQYYGNGDYLYGRYRNAANAGPEFYRTTVRPNYPNGDYDMLVTLVMGGQSITRHDTSHPTDEARAYYETGFKEYRPLFNENKHNTTASVGADVRNDYIFFGQHLNNTKPSDGINYTKQVYPSHIVNTSNTVSSMRNRVYRAYGYYGSSSDNAFHFNTQVFAMDANLTAIDFTGFHDTNVADEPSDATWTTENQNGWYRGTKIVPSKYSIHYPPMLDMPKSFMVSANAKDLNVCEGVTRNLLVYTPADESGGANVGGTTPAENTYSIVRNSIGYTEATPESDIVAHQVVKKATSGETAYQAALFHLVERDSESQPNNDFNAPIAFDVTNRAWYTRQPKYYRNLQDDGYGNGSAWEGICLPFTATKVTAEKNGEISHFYGEDGSADHSLHHEYWLRGLTAVTGTGDKTATFARPAVYREGIDVAKNFVEEKQTTAARTYNYPANTYFTSLYNYNKHYDTRDDEGNDTFEHHDEAWYAKPHEFANYTPLTAEVPYIVAFPGDDYYEFTMESYYKTAEYGNVKYAQKATFESGATSIAVSDGNMVSTVATGYTHKGTYLHQTDLLGINSTGSAFESGTTVFPFRTYMATVSSPARDYNTTRSVIYIGTANDEGVISEEQLRPGDPDNGIVEDSMRIFVRGNRLIVESTYGATLNVHTYGGQLVRILDVTEGTNTYSGFAPGMYIVNGKKLVIRR